MQEVMLYFGSFNPVHKGHIAIAEYTLREKLCDELWFVISPHNPLKADNLIIDERHRLEMVRIAIAGSEYAARMRACDVEFSMPKPSYTVDTLIALGEIYPDTRFSLLFGTDIVEQFDRWKEWQYIRDHYKIYIYPRRGYDPGMKSYPFTFLDGAAYFDYSSTDVRESLANGDASRMLPVGVLNYINNSKLWQ